MEDIKVIREKFRKYLYKLVADNKLSKVDADTQYSDADYPRKHADELGINYWEAFRDDASLENLLSILKERFEKEGKNPSTIVSYKRALKSFRNFIEEQYAGVKNMRNGSQKKYYWVCQGQQKENKKYILAPVDNFHHHKRVNELKVGDVVISYFNQQVNAISTVIKNPEIIKNGNDDWYKAVLDYKELDKPIPKSVIKNIMKNNNIKSFIYGPFNVNYDYNQGYLFNFSKELLDLILENDQEVKIMKSSRKEEKQPLNQILYGPPGTGKTYNTVIKAMEIINPNCLEYDEKGKVSNYFDVKKEFDKAKDNHQIEFVTFHQSYSYEEFVEGIKPDLAAWDESVDKLTYKGANGIFKEICKSATKKITDNFEDVYNNFINEVSKVDEDDFYKLYTLKNHKIFGLQVNSNNNLNIYMTDNFNKQGVITKENLKKHFENMRVARDWINYYDAIIEHLKSNYNLVSENTVLKPHVLIIDEINRGNISKIFGELITLIEDDKRENLSVKLPYSQESFTVPKNLYILGTMNTSDRSIASIDIALRRRFKFKEMMPKADLVADFNCNFHEYFAVMNERISVLLDRDHQIGHSYFIKNTHQNDGIDELKDIWFDSILPLLNEYFYSDWEKLQALLGSAKVDNTSFIKKIEKITFANSYTCEDDENYDFVNFDDCNFIEAMKNAFGDSFEVK